MDPLSWTGLHGYGYVSNHAVDKTDATGLFESIATLSVAMGMMNTLAGAQSTPSFEGATAVAVGKCGPDATNQIVYSLYRLESDWNRWTPSQKWAHYKSAFLPLGMQEVAWDIPALKSDLGWIGTDCPGCPTGICAQEGGTISIDGQCFRPATVNYVLFGKMASLAGLDIAQTLVLVAGFKRYKYGKWPDNDTIAWTTAGWNGWPSGSHPHASYPLSQAIITGCKAKKVFNPPYRWLTGE
ncbi:MAG: hypothetical protein JW775_02310 [Candidatus Aminicenantes bacterium]|nr:hypothetical protein [Candidatus Aminicenantes bacterium]